MRDEEYPYWKDKFGQMAEEQGIKCAIDINFVFHNNSSADNVTLYDYQKNFLGIVLLECVKTSSGINILTNKKGCWVKCWIATIDHYTKHQAADSQSNKLLIDVLALKILEFPSWVEYPTKYSKLVNNYDTIYTNFFPENLKISFLETALMREKHLSVYVTM